MSITQRLGEKTINHQNHLFSQKLGCENLLHRRILDDSMLHHEAFEKCSISFKFKEDGNFNHRNTLSISRIKI